MYQIAFENRTYSPRHGFVYSASNGPNICHRFSHTVDAIKAPTAKLYHCSAIKIPVSSTRKSTEESLATSSSMLEGTDKLMFCHFLERVIFLIKTKQ